MKHVRSTFHFLFFLSVAWGANAGQMVLYTGILHQGDKFDRRLTCLINDREKTPSHSGEYSVLIEDKEGKYLERLDLEVSFMANIDPVGQVPMKMSPFLAALPYHASGRKLKLFHKKILLDEYDLSKIAGCPSADDYIKKHNAGTGAK